MIDGTAKSALRVIALGVSLLSLSGCLSIAGLPDNAEEEPDLGLHRAELAGGDVVVVPPQGYCIEKETLRIRATGGFALLASCETLTGYVSGYDVEPLVLTVTAVPRQSEAPEPDAEEIAAALGDRTVLRRVHGDGLTIVQVMASEGLTPQDDPRHWRAMMVLNGKMVGLALYGPRGSAVTAEKGLTMLNWQAERLREESPQMPHAYGPLAGTDPVLAAGPAAAGDAAAKTGAAVISGPDIAADTLAPIRPGTRPGTWNGAEAGTAPGGRKRRGMKKIFADLFS
ncbi:hypothetical protein [Thalassovita aquimarina]|uniref:Uncharacterized protein n=1 Tax=Thalassovita aquimarina TaxID=2785917 RepID=A0ABS5HTU0_9RHOB|nr:hypothetical protein [Thalassovita aquimarina]MBR9652399.1 hypothetical protein [Thalassovita aquimarina]